MASPIIEVTGLSKRYRLGSIGPLSLRDTANRWWEHLRGTVTETEKNEDFWALRDVSFAVQPGEVLGVIGRNGAGKSTLLKILSRITEPTSGRAVIRGRVASLLEVGTGFHPELSGRENIFLNGAILGMSRAEVRKKFDEIVDFSEVHQFIDTPVKRYSSGMYVRLAFAVAAHLEPEILIIDEVLAVGDVQFQQKCLGKMQTAAGNDGRTVLFVSHNMAAVNSLCQRVVWMEGGRVEAEGPTYPIVSRYLLAGDTGVVSGERDLRDAPRRGGDQQLRFNAVWVRNEHGEVTAFIENTRPFTLEFEFEVYRAMQGEIGLIIRSHDDVSLIRTSTEDAAAGINFSPGTHRIACHINPNHLRPGRYHVLVGSTCGSLRDLIERAIDFEIVASRDTSATTMRGMPGYFHFDFPWIYHDS